MFARIVGPEEGERMLRILQRKRGAQPVDLPVVALAPRKGANKSIQLTREHIYPTEYKPAVFPKNIEDLENFKGTFPVTPATPTAFESRDLGIKITYDIRRISGNTLDFGWKFHRSAFIGAVNHGKPITTTATDLFGRPVEVVITENIMAMAAFSTDAGDSEFTIPGDRFLIRTGRKQPAPPSKDATFIPAPPQPSASANSDWIVLIHVTAPRTP
jgi:general secretion pathway protein D